MAPGQSFIADLLYAKNTWMTIMERRRGREFGHNFIALGSIQGN